MDLEKTIKPMTEKPTVFLYSDGDLSFLPPYVKYQSLINQFDLIKDKIAFSKFKYVLVSGLKNFIFDPLKKELYLNDKFPLENEFNLGYKEIDQVQTFVQNGSDCLKNGYPAEFNLWKKDYNIKTEIDEEIDSLLNYFELAAFAMDFLKFNMTKSFLFKHNDDEFKSVEEYVGCDLPYLSNSSLIGSDNQSEFREKRIKRLADTIDLYAQKSIEGSDKDVKPLIAVVNPFVLSDESSLFNLLEKKGINYINTAKSLTDKMSGEELLDFYLQSENN